MSDHSVFPTLAPAAVVADAPLTRVVFLVSLPRSGSTLLQKMLSVSPEIASSAEPWILLPLWGCTQPEAGAAVYAHDTAALAINDFVKGVDGGEAAYARAVRAFAMTLYAAASRGKAIYLDKTPRYHLMLPLLDRAFPEERRILLLRHPLAVLASLGQTFNNNRFRWFDFWIDWVEGHRNLAAAVRRARPQDLVVRYEDLVVSPDAELERLCAHIGVAHAADMPTAFGQVQLGGHMGDPTGGKRYKAVSGESVERWREFFDTPFRRRRARWMLEQISDADLETLGYPRSRLLAELVAQPARHSFDLAARIDQFVGWAAHAFDYRYLRARLRARRTQRSYAHGYFRLP